MIIRDLLGMLHRQWLIVAVVLLITAAACAHLVSTSGVYTTRVLISFAMPTEAALDEGSSIEPGVITFAATVADEVDQNTARVRYADADAHAYGIGVTQGVFVGVPDVGGQWTVSYRTAEIFIDVVGPTFDWVKKQQQTAIARVFNAADAQQDAIGIAADARVEYTVEPLSTQIMHIMPSRPIQMLALVALSAAGVMAAGLAAVGWDRRRMRSRHGAHRREAADA